MRWPSDHSCGILSGTGEAGKILLKGVEMRMDELKTNLVVRGGIFPQPVKILLVQPVGDAVKIGGQGMKSGQVHEPVLSAQQVAALQANAETEPFDGNACIFAPAWRPCAWHRPTNTILTLRCLSRGWTADWRGRRGWGYE